MGGVGRVSAGKGGEVAVGGGCHWRLQLVLRWLLVGPAAIVKIGELRSNPIVSRESIEWLYMVWML